jgi:hypothetical protein
MDIPHDVIAAKETIKGPLLQSGLITGIALGLRDEDNPDPNDLALRVFVAAADAVPDEVQTALDGFSFPTVIIQQVFELTTTVTLPDTQRYRPVQGGCSVSPSRFVPTGNVPFATLGQVVQDASGPRKFYGLGNLHVLYVDIQRQVGDEIAQPQPQPSPLGLLPGDRVGALDRWAFPENEPSGPVNAAIFLIEGDSIPEIIDIGPVIGTIDATLGMQVTKPGRTTGQTFGMVNDFRGSFPLEFPGMPSVGTPPSIWRTFTNQIQIRNDFPTSAIFGDHGDSGSVVVGGQQNQGRGLLLCVRDRCPRIPAALRPGCPGRGRGTGTQHHLLSARSVSMSAQHEPKILHGQQCVPPSLVTARSGRHHRESQAASLADVRGSAFGLHQRSRAMTAVTRITEMAYLRMGRLPPW